MKSVLGDMNSKGNWCDLMEIIPTRPIWRKPGLIYLYARIFIQVLKLIFDQFIINTNGCYELDYGLQLYTSHVNFFVSKILWLNNVL